MSSHKPPVTTETGEIIWGVMAEFESPAHLTHAAEMVRDAGYQKWDVYSPFAVHGMNEAMGLRSSKVGLIVGGCAFLGASGALLMQWWMSAIDFKLIVAGKPLFAWEQFLPITFELGVLISAFGALLGMLALNGLPMWRHPLLEKERFLRASDDRFIIAIESKDKHFDLEKTRSLLERAGGVYIDTVED